MFIKLFVIGLMLLPVSALADEEELVIVPVEYQEIPDAVKSVMGAIGELDALDAGVGFFMDKDIFIAPIEETIPPSVSYDVTQLQEAVAKEAKLHGYPVIEDEVIPVTSGKVKIVQDRYGWGVFTVNTKNEDELLNREPTQFLKFSKFHPGDTVFILTNAHYSDRDSSAGRVYEKRLIMKVSSSDVQNIESEINFKESQLLDAIRITFSGVAVNQKGEVIGFLNLKLGRRKRLVALHSGVIDFFSEVRQETLNTKGGSEALPIQGSVRIAEQEQNRCDTLFTREN
ncbi:MAG: hypothetical protein OXK80_04555 [Bdellovibrionales bacterium]|nr:hypothetical protein [Bdellovibrionales bacterium]